MVNAASVCSGGIWSPPKPSWQIVCPSFSVSEGIGVGTASIFPEAGLADLGQKAQHSLLPQRRGELVVVGQAQVGEQVPLPGVLPPRSPVSLALRTNLSSGWNLAAGTSAAAPFARKRSHGPRAGRAIPSAAK